MNRNMVIGLLVTLAGIFYIVAGAAILAGTIVATSLPGGTIAIVGGVLLFGLGMLKASKEEE